MKKILFVILVLMASCGSVRHTGAPYYSKSHNYGKRVQLVQLRPLKFPVFKRKPMSQRDKYHRRMKSWCTDPAYNNHEKY